MLKLLTGVAHYPLMQEAGAEGGGGGGGAEGGQQGGQAAGAESGAQGAENQGGQAAEGGKKPGTESGGSEGGDSLLDGIDGEEGGDEIQALDFSKGKPEGFPDELWDSEKNAPKADQLYKKLQEAENRAKGLRDKLARGEGKPPKDAKEYTVDAGDKGKALLKSDDPLLAEAQKIAHELKIPKETYGKFMGKLTDFLADHLEKMQEQGPAELSDEQKAEIRKAEYAKIGTNAVQVIKAVESWGRELKASGQLSEKELEAFKSMAMTGEQVRVLNKLRAMAGGGNALPMDFSDDGLPSDEEIADLIGNIKTEADERKVNELLDKRRRAGRPEKLQIKA
jgi:hypothetical protein